MIGACLRGSKCEIVVNGGDLLEEKFAVTRALSSFNIVLESITIQITGQNKSETGSSSICADDVS